MNYLRMKFQKVLEAKSKAIMNILQCFWNMLKQILSNLTFDLTWKKLTLRNPCNQKIKKLTSFRKFKNKFLTKEILPLYSPICLSSTIKTPQFFPKYVINTWNFNIL